MASLSSKMKTLVLCDGYEMRHDTSNTLKTIQYWWGLKKFCSGRAKSGFGGTRNLEPTKAHNCHKRSSKIELRQQIAGMKMDALSSHTKPTIDLISSGKEGISDAELLRLPNDRALQRMIQHVRKPVGASSVEIEWFQFFTQTKQFFLVDSRLANQAAICHLSVAVWDENSVTLLGVACLSYGSRSSMWF